jgi:hypothetical protein
MLDNTTINVSTATIDERQLFSRRCHVVSLRPDEAVSVKLRLLRRSRPSIAP